MNEWRGVKVQSSISGLLSIHPLVNPCMWLYIILYYIWMQVNGAKRKWLKSTETKIGRFRIFFLAKMQWLTLTYETHLSSKIGLFFACYIYIYSWCRFFFAVQFLNGFFCSYIFFHQDDDGTKKKSNYDDGREF